MNAVSRQAAPTEGDLYAQLGSRLGEALLERRLRAQQELEAHLAVQGEGFFRLERHIRLEGLITVIFKMTGLYGRGYRNYLKIRLIENRVVLPRLPAAFEGFRILHLADLHTDLDPALPDAVIAALAGVEYDLCVNTGDFRNRTRDCHRASMEQTARIYRHLPGPKAGVLGNHDFIEKVPDLEAMGIRVLLNEALPLERSGQTLWLAGVDDPYFYQTHDLARALREVPPTACKLLLSHSPQTYREAEGLGVDLMLSGHTHGGQFCLPGGRALITHCPAPRALVAGDWTYGRMRGYTSRGTGAGCVPLRLNCPAEVTLHTLTRHA
ncbi:metallophosphoesterase [Ruficoccus amylovorans]|uniref:Metallophosphoesterase n=1 Tax=Ruficoccus amylovorans TaxID=1804625 RepID=A0A842HMZ3_9BACT|nr:metallophosphoesterase [Ruficoccus amylovorans]MBC2596451.1 metallophosphoesterase [Ruficoccus amylovorans]